jgi:5'-3' exonuclease
MIAKKEIFLIDGSSYIYRAFYAMRNLSTSKGMPTNAAYIFSRMLLKLIKDKKPEFMCFVMDSKGPTERHGMYEEYKATRQKMPEALQVQIPYIIRIVEALGIPTLRKEGRRRTTSSPRPPGGLKRTIVSPSYPATRTSCSSWTKTSRCGTPSRRRSMTPRP